MLRWDAQADGGFATKNTEAKSGLPEGGSLSVVAVFCNAYASHTLHQNYRCEQILWLTSFGYKPYFAWANGPN